MFGSRRYSMHFPLVVCIVPRASLRASFVSPLHSLFSLLFSARCQVIQEVVFVLPATGPRLRKGAGKAHQGRAHQSPGTKGKREYEGNSVPAVVMGRGEPNELVSLPFRDLESVIQRLGNRGDQLVGSLLEMHLQTVRKNASSGQFERSVEKQLVTPHRVVLCPFTNRPLHVELVREVAGDVRGAPHLTTPDGRRKVPV
jgi:hypothetical protein